MIDIALARGLRAAGLAWEPAPGDRFVLPDRDMDKDVFVISDMTVEVHDFPTGRVIGFNGVTEWALDSVQHSEALWLPSEEQLRVALGPCFRALWRDHGGWVVSVTTRSGVADFEAEAPDVAYARALLAVLRREVMLPGAG
jgi:hypothetical protein